MTRTHEIICAREHDSRFTGFYCPYTKAPVVYIVTIEALATPDAPTTPSKWRLSAVQLRGTRPKGRRTAPHSVDTINEARAMANTLHHRHVRYLEKTLGREQLRQVVREEELQES